MAGKHGGARPGAGRKKGVPNVRQQAKIVKDLMERGESPLDYFVSIMKDQNEPVTRRDWAAAQAAPYCHPRLASVDQTTTFKTDPLSDILNAIDGRTTGIKTGTEDDKKETLQ
ncbi:MAG: hypothetical protein GEU95_10390 [Rhizobiales bacterium]|nr:hypothetical protein [Hyphomicrobiales bacterium]